MKINLDLQEVKALVGGKLSSDQSFFIDNINALEQAGKNDIAVVFDRGEESVFDDLEMEKIKNSNAGIILAKVPLVEGKSYLIVDNPLESFQKIVSHIEDKSKPHKDKIHNTALIGKDVFIEDGVCVGAYSVIKSASQIGQDTQIDTHVFIGKNVIVGNNVKIFSGVKILDKCMIGDNSIIHPGVVIGSDGFGYQVNKQGLQKVPQVGIVKIGKNVELGANCCIDRASFGKTFIGDGVKLDNMVHVGHNVAIGCSCAILAQTVIGGGTKIGNGCQIGGHVAIKDHVKIGNFVKILSKSGVLKDITDGQVVAGVPAISFFRWKKISVLLAKLPQYIGLLNKFEKGKSKGALVNTKLDKGFWRKIFKI